VSTASRVEAPGGYALASDDRCVGFRPDSPNRCARRYRPRKLANAGTLEETMNPRCEASRRIASAPHVGADTLPSGAPP